MRVAVQLAEAGAKWRAVSRKTEAGKVSGRAIYDEAKIIGVTNVGSELERAKSDGAKTLFWTDLEAGGVGVGFLAYQRGLREHMDKPLVGDKGPVET